MAKTADPRVLGVDDKKPGSCRSGGSPPLTTPPPPPPEASPKTFIVVVWTTTPSISTPPLSPSPPPPPSTSPSSSRVNVLVCFRWTLDSVKPSLNSSSSNAGKSCENVESAPC